MPQARFHPSEVVTIGILLALKGGHFRAFYRWLSRDFSAFLDQMVDSHITQYFIAPYRDFLPTSTPSTQSGWF